MTDCFILFIHLLILDGPFDKFQIPIESGIIIWSIEDVRPSTPFQLWNKWSDEVLCRSLATCVVPYLFDHNCRHLTGLCFCFLLRNPYRPNVCVIAVQSTSPLDLTLPIWILLFKLFWKRISWDVHYFLKYQKTKKKLHDTTTYYFNHIGGILQPWYIYVLENHYLTNVWWVAVKTSLSTWLNLVDLIFIFLLFRHLISWELYYFSKYQNKK